MIVLSKRPEPGRSKTRLTPPCTPEEGARLAAAALADTLDAVAAVPAARHVLVMEGDATGWRHPRFEVVGQRGDGLDERLAGAFDDVGGPAVLVGMDTPQLRPTTVAGCVRRIEASGVRPRGRTPVAVLGRALDGGWWTIGLPDPDPDAFLGVPMSRPTTGRRQAERLTERGYLVVSAGLARDVDQWADALVVAGEAPNTRFARAVADVARRIGHLEGAEAS